MSSFYHKLIIETKNILRPVKRRFNTIIHHGNCVTCNCCGHSFRTFRHLGYGGKKVGACWFCDSYPRTRMLKDYIEMNFSPRFKGRKILHIAPEIQIFKWLNVASEIDYITGDKRTEGYRYPDSVINLDITQLPFDNDSFDVVICNHVLEHVKNDFQAMSEIYRVLRAEGVAILLIPIDKDIRETIEEPADVTFTPEEREAHFGQFDHVRQYGLDYYDRLKSAGFEVEIIPPNQETIAKYGLFSEEDMIICHKHA